MASVTMMASFLGGASVAHRPLVGQPRSLVVARATVRAESQDLAKPNVDVDEKISGRRAAVFAAAAAAISVAGQGIALAEELKRGTPEARKAYAPVCVTMPTARICHKIA
ncbi:putative photosystem II 5 kDa protein, chloroplastic [Iris pallida]|uniref:Photosystem II 5 kDa protein, chloroplastic n=1 Tax=Iris pallida TaxID=29817 RepID=A0AAX6HKJ6_IRIPA|nr:putative photosystem II 5 kDa protein, chloroplastic [Iris pallida]